MNEGSGRSGGKKFCVCLIIWLLPIVSVSIRIEIEKHSTKQVFIHIADLFVLSIRYYSLLIPLFVCP